MTTAGFNRRKFLIAGAAVAGGAAIAGAGGGALAAAAQERASGIDYDSLRRAMSGKLLHPGDSGYDLASQPWNLALSARKPAAVAQVATQLDVIECVKRAGGQGVPLAARSGGHNYAGYSTPEAGVVVDVTALNKVTIREDGTAVVGAGARLMEVYSALAKQGRALPGGTCASVGIAGLTLGGGIGPLTRAYGLTSDRLLAVTVVTADGAVHTVDANRDTELFWALRGGGGGHAGIVTDFTFSTVPAPKPTVFKLVFPKSHTAKVLAAWSAWQAAAPKELTSTCNVGSGPDADATVEGAWTGTSASTLDPHLKALISQAGTSPSSRTVKQKSYLDAMLHFAECAEVKSCYLDTKPGGKVHRSSFHAASRVLARVLKQADADRVVEIMRGFSDTVLLFDGLGGAVDTLAAKDTAYAHRGATASVQIYSWSDSDKNGQVLNQTQQAITRVIGEGSYVNYVNPLQTDWATANWGANLPKLRQVVSAYDPGKVFDFPQSVLRG